MGAAWREHAGIALGHRIRHLARNQVEAAARSIVVELAGEERAGIRVARRTQDLRHRPGLDDRAPVHDAQVVAELGDEAEMMPDEDDRAGETASQLLEERHDLRFHRRIERRGRLVGEQEIGPDEQRHRDHHPLAHAAGELVRIGGEAQGRIREADARQRRDCARPRRLAGEPGMAPAQDIDEMRADT